MDHLKGAGKSGDVRLNYTAPRSSWTAVCCSIAGWTKCSACTTWLAHAVIGVKTCDRHIYIPFLNL
jgi:hypothetical protein